jgi:molybdopterin-guanine dinucleotide biosynthesis protein A
VYDRRVDAVTIFILAGGKSTRMGQDKAFLEWKGKTLLACALEVAGTVSPAVRIVGDQSRFSKWGMVIEDVYQGRGPLGAIHAALTNSTTEWNFMMAVDMPFVEEKFVKWLLGKAWECGAVVTVPRVGIGFQPLCAVYRKSFSLAAQKSLEAGRNKIDPLFAEVDTQIIEEDELVRSGFSARMFRNLNTREEWRRAEKDSESES